MEQTNKQPPVTRKRRWQDQIKKGAKRVTAPGPRRRRIISHFCFL